MVLKLVPANFTDKDSRICGVKEVPGLSAHLKRETKDKGFRRAGGIPVIVFEDVNVEGLPDNFMNRDMGRAHDFFDALMTQAFQSGKIVIVTTGEEKVARYFQGLNRGTNVSQRLSYGASKQHIMFSLLLVHLDGPIRLGWTF
jgi:hypothetical protein